MFILLLVTIGAVAGEIASSAECEAVTKRTDNLVKTSIPELVVDEFSRTTDELAFMSGFHNDNSQEVGGVTSAIPLVQQEVMPNMAILPGSKGVCIRPAINIIIGYQSLSVFMDNEIPRRSCIYNAIFAHEMHHVSIFKDYIANHQKQIKQSMDDKFNGRAYYFRSIFEAKQYAQISGEATAQHLTEKFISEVNAEQAALDTQAEYSRMELQCLPAGHPM